MLDLAIKKSAVLIEALPYIKQFQGKIIVIKLGGSAQNDEGILAHIFTDIDFMVSVGMRPVIVHGGGPSITKAMQESGIEAQFIQGQRVTCAKTMDIVSRVLIDEVNPHLIELMAQVGGHAEPLNGRDHRFLKALKKTLPTGEDLGFVGNPVAIDASLVFDILNRGHVPMIAPVAHGLGDDWDTLYNVNGDTASAVIARQLHAEKLVFFMDADGIRSDRDNPDTLLSTVNRQTITDLTASGAISAGMIPKTQAALFALKGGVKKIHIVSGAKPHALLLEIFTKLGIGTEIVAE